MNLKEKLNRENSLMEVLRETKQLNDLMKSYIQVQMDTELVRNNNIVLELEEIKNQLTEIAIYIPTNKKRLLSKVYNNKGISLENLEQYESAMECYKKALELNPNNNSVLLNMGVTHDQMGNHKEAIEHFDQIISNYEIFDLKNVDYDILDFSTGDTEELQEELKYFLNDSSK